MTITIWLNITGNKVLNTDIISAVSTMSPYCTVTTIPVSIPACSHIEEVMVNGEGEHLVQLGKTHEFDNKICKVNFILYMKIAHN